ncbi:MAG: NRAMP family divalent metal transporter [Acidimicrobiia bacterium]
MKRLFAVTLGVLTAIGGFMDAGDIVANATAGARFGMGLLWAMVLGVGGIVVYAEMAGRVAAVSGRPTFDLVRERLGARMGVANLAASFFINVLTLVAEIAGMAVVIQLATDVNYLLWLPLTGLFVWIVVWRVRFSTMETAFGLVGLTLVVMAVALWQLHPDWSALWHSSRPHVTGGEGTPTYFYYAIGLFGAAMTPYEVFFFSSGAVEEHWSRRDLAENRANVFVGFPLGGFLSFSLMALATVVLQPRGIGVDHLGTAALPTVLALGKVGLALLLVGFFAATFGAALETSLSAGYTLSQYFGWQWGKFVRPREASRFHLTMIGSIVIAVLVALTAVDPIKVTEYSIVLSAAALPLTYFPILVVANDPDYMGDKVNGRFGNAIASFYLVVIMVAALATVPLMIVTKAGQ